MFDARRWLPVFRWNNWQTGGYSYRKVRSSKNLPDLSLFINVWVIDFGEDQNFWWFEGVIGRKVQCKFERAFIVGCLKIFYFSEKVNNCTSEGFNAPDQLRIDCSETARSLTLVSWISFEDWRSLYSFVSRLVPDILKLCSIVSDILRNVLWTSQYQSRKFSWVNRVSASCAASLAYPAPVQLLQASFVQVCLVSHDQGVFETLLWAISVLRSPRQMRRRLFSFDFSSNWKFVQFRKFGFF